MQREISLTIDTSFSSCYDKADKISRLLINPPKFLNFMHYIYILQSIRDKNLYVGCTNNLKKRFLLHNNGKIFSTKKRKPFKLIYYEAFLNQKDAFAREQWLKTGWGRNQIKKVLNNYFKI